MAIYRLPYSKPEFNRALLIVLILNAVITPCVLYIIVSYVAYRTIKFKMGLLVVIGIFIFLSFILYFASVTHSKKYGEFTPVTTIFSDKEIRIVYNENCRAVEKREIILKAKDLCDLKLKKAYRFGIYIIGVKYMPREIYERYHSTFGMYGFVRLGVGTKEQFEILRKEIEEFKKRNNIFGCKKEVKDR